MNVSYVENGQTYSRSVLEDPAQLGRQSGSHTIEESGFGPSTVIRLSPKAQQMLAKSQAQTATSQTPPPPPPSPGGNPDGTVTTVEEVVVVGQRQTLFTVSFPPPIPWNPDGLADEIDNTAQEPIELTSCQKETVIDRAALEAGEILEDLPSNKEWGMYLVRDPDGSVRGVGPIEGRNVNGQNTIRWDATGAELGITGWSQLVGIIHTHPSFGYDALANQFSPADEAVTNAFETRAAPEFRQYVVANGEIFQFDKHAEAGDVSHDTVDGNGCDDI